MTKENKPMIIDFGKARFKLDDLLFELNDDTSARYDDPYINVTHDMMQLLCSLFIPKSQSLLIKSNSQNKMDYIIDVYSIFNFVKNSNSYILEGKVIEKFMRNKYKQLFIPYPNFYLKYQMMNGVDLNELLISEPKIKLVIRSSDLALNLGLDNMDD
jgi:hypothetical protein